MSEARRNSISYDNERIVFAVAVLSGIVAAVFSSAPTGTTAIDIVLVAAFAASVTWAGASAPWWALVAAGGLATAGAVAGPLILSIPAIAATAAAARIGWHRDNQPITRAVIAGVVVQVVLRIEWNPFFLSSALLAAAAMGVIAYFGVRRRRGYLRKRVWIGLIAVGGFTAIAVAGIGIAAFQARTTARDGYTGMLDGLEFVQQGNPPEAAAALRQAAADLDDARSKLDSPITQLARFVPGVAQNRNASTQVLGRAADAAESAADTLDLVDLDQLTVQDGVIDVGAFAALAPPLEDLQATIEDLDDALHDAESPWLINPFQSRLDNALDRADQLVPQARATAAAARTAPAMLGADGERRYFVAFVNTAEARGMGGLMGNWSEVTVENGRLRVTANGRTARLQKASLNDLELDVTDEYLTRYAAYGASHGGGVNVKYWGNVTIPPDMPSVGNAMAQMYENATGRAVDGVVVIDPAGIPSLLEIGGPVELTDIGTRVDSSNAEQFLTIGQYEFAENEREDLLEAVTDQTIDNVLDGSLPPPQQLAPILAPAALNGHISAWAVRPDEQDMLELVGMDASLPVIRQSGTDALAVSNNNASGNKIESFLQRTIEYRATVDQRSGEVVATLRVEFTNTSPTSGYPDYVIGNRLGRPVGINRTVVDVHTQLDVQAARLDGLDIATATLPELGYNAWQSIFEVPAGETSVLELDLAGNVGPGGYQLVYRPQSLPNHDELRLSATTTGGSSIFEYEGDLERRSVLSADGVEAWR